MTHLLDGRIRYRVKIIGTFRGLPWEYHDPEGTESQFLWIEDNDPSEYWWSEGSMSCDCNRIRFLPKEMQDILIAEKGDNLCGGCEINIDRIEPLEGNNLPSLILNESQ